MNTVAPLLAARLRRDWLQLVLWIGSTVALTIAGYTGVLSTYGDEQERAALLATVMANPVILLFRGLPSGPEQSSFIVFLLLPWLSILAAFMSTFLAVRHTRGEEEPGRLELVSATTAGRWAPTMATLTHGVIANVLLGILVAVSFIACGADTEGSLLVGTSVTVLGLTFLGAGLVSAQLMRTSRGANSLSVWVLLLSFVTAGIGNALGTPSDDLTRMESSPLAWLSPFGWIENTRAFDENTWWPLALCLGAFLILGAGALALQSTRDLGESLFAGRRGRATAAVALSSTTALVARLSRGSTIGWMVGALLTGVLSTSLGSVVEELGGDNPAVADVLSTLSGEADLTQGVVVTFFIMVGLLASCAAVQTVTRARQEETHGTAEVVLASPVQRVRWLADFIVVGFVAVVLTCAAAVAGAMLGALQTDAGPDLLHDVLVCAAGQVVAASVFLAITGLVFVLAPRLTIGLAWALVALAAIVGLFGPLFGMPEAVVNLSPFDAAPTPSGDGIDPRGLWWLLLTLAVGLIGALTLMRRRELTTDG